VRINLGDGVRAGDIGAVYGRSPDGLEETGLEIAG